LLDNALASMGAGLPSAMVAKMVYPDRRVMAICGDGGFMMNSQELKTAVQLGLDLVVLVLRDDAYGMIKWKQKDMGFDDFGLDFTNPDFVAYAHTHGASGSRVESVDQLTTMVEQAFAARGVQLIDVAIDYAADDHILNHEIKELSAML
jgi:acetolactate synthase-1/2/3 large subunit